MCQGKEPKDPVGRDFMNVWRDKAGFRVVVVLVELLVVEKDDDEERS